MDITYLTVVLIWLEVKLASVDWAFPGGLLESVLGAFGEESFIPHILGEIYICKPDKNMWKGD